MIKTFEEAVKFLEGYIPSSEKKHPGELGLKRMEYLMDLLGNPQFKYPTIHVGGTSGKGSTATIIASILATKYKIGLHTSPHLVKINERIKILSKNKKQKTKNKLDIPDNEFIALLNKIIPSINKLEKSELGKPSYFEIVTAMAFLYFYIQNVDFAVIEVGMGGNYDATNVIKPLVAVLTNVGLDHTEILGDTVERIAEDKAGIIKSGIQVVTGVNQPSVIEIISAMCNVQSAKLNLLNKDFEYKIKKMGEKGSVFDYFGRNTYRNLKLSLLGEHQVENAALAIRAVEKLSVVSCQLSVKNIKTGLKEANIPGRLEVIQKNPLVILDGAHNPDKVKALVNSVKRIFPKRKVVAIIAIKNDKNAREMLNQLLKISGKVIFTKFELTADIGIISSYDPKELLRVGRLIDQTKPMEIITNPNQALDSAIKSTKTDDLILITGSLYLVGETRKFLMTNY